jgi:hypothetical protein
MPIIVGVNSYLTRLCEGRIRPPMKSQWGLVVSGHGQSVQSGEEAKQSAQLVLTQSWLLANGPA